MRIGNSNIFLFSALAVAISSSPGLAQSDEKPGLFASADISIVHDDNIYRVTDDLAQSDTFLRLAPELSALGGIGKHRFQLSYTGDYAKFSDASEADYADHDLRGRIDLEHSLRFSSRFEAGYQKDHEDPGSINRLQLDMTEYNKYDQNFLLAGIAYGSEQAIGRLAFNYRRTDKDYTTNDLDYLDFVSDQLTGRFTYRIAPNTRVYAEAIISELNYTPRTTFELDNTYKRYRAGITWDFTGKLTGDVNVGYQDRDYELDTLRDIDGLAYDGEITWSVNTFTKVVGAVKRESIDSSIEETGGFLRTSYGINLKHELTERLKITADAGYSKDELVFTASREDKRHAYQFGLDYELMRNIKLTANYTYEERDSTLSIADYQANSIGIGVIVSLDD
ncbi:outer membrane beta-barrel protein [Alteromonas lipolytica]|nr:outer membrane beta-barrel protein [Alteromonas lipolytica]